MPETNQTNIAKQIARITSDRNSIRTKLVELNLATSTDTLDDLATAVTGIENRGAVSANVKEGETYTIPKGYHNGSGTVSGVAGGGNYTLQSKAATPTKAEQNITPDSGYYGLSDVTINPIPANYQDVSSVTAAAADVLTGKVIVDATGKVQTGSMANNGAVNKTLTPAATSYTVPKGYHDGKGVVNILTEEKTAMPTKAAQTIVPTTGKVISKVTVAAIPDAFVDTTDATATAAEILSGKTAYVGPDKLTGTMPNNGATALTIDGMSAMSVNVPAGYTSGGTVTLTDDIETALAAI